jgi:hypothetical protein
MKWSLPSPPSACHAIATEQLVIADPPSSLSLPVRHQEAVVHSRSTIVAAIARSHWHGIAVEHVGRRCPEWCCNLLAIVAEADELSSVLRYQTFGRIFRHGVVLGSGCCRSH